MKKLIVALTLIATFGLCAKAELFRLKIDDFTSLNVSDNLNVVYKCMPDSAGYAVYECEPSVARALIFESKKNRLRIQYETDTVDPKVMPTITVYSTTINKIENNGDSTVTAMDLPPVPSLKVRVIGNGTIVASGIHANSVDAEINTGCGHIVLSGNANRAKMRNVGTGPIEAGALKAATVSVALVGTGPVDCYASEKLSISGMGSGKVYYKGNPAKVTNHSIGIKAINMDAE